MISDAASLLKRFKPIEELYIELISGTDDPLSDRTHKFYALSRSCVASIAGWTSQYAQQIDTELAREAYFDHDGRANLGAHVRPIYGAIQALKADVAAGYMRSLQELVHADLFSDFLESAAYFLDEGHKDAAAVLVGGVLENHLRLLCRKHGVVLEAPNAKGVMKPKMGDALNVDLKSHGVYNLSVQKQITAWQGIRNDAAHGNYNEYTAEQVKLMLDGVRQFISNFPA